MITDHQADVLRHTSNNGRYVTDEPAVIAMGEAGLLYDHGPQVLAGGAHYLTMTSKGRTALNEWQSAQPKPIVHKRRRTEAFDRWRDYCDAFQRISFSRFWKEIWPSYRYWK